ncbi:hypothetical protein QQ045_007922 [Rhodiola kirilowii]
MEFWSPICSTTYYSVKKTIFYNFFPSKMVEATCNETHLPFQWSEQLIEIRDVQSQPGLAFLGIRRILTDSEVHEGKIHLTHHVAFEHVFRLLSMYETSIVVFGNGTGIFLTLWDFTGYDSYENLMFDSTLRHQALFQKCPDGHYSLEISELIVMRRIRPGDEFLLIYRQELSAFTFKLWRRNRNVIQ